MAETQKGGRGGNAGRRTGGKIMAACGLLLVSTLAFANPDILETISVKEVITDMTADRLTQQVKEINENQRVKAVLLEVDSPGGGVLPSAVIYEELSKLHVPVVGYCQNICASGGMYILMAPSVKYIGVRTETLSGSIGVISHNTRYYRLLDWAKIDSETYKSGVAKDTGNPERAATPADTKELQGIVDLLAGRFYKIVEKSRGAKIKDMAAIKTAMVFFGEDGVKAGLVDEVMSKEAVIKKAKALSGSASIFTREELKKMSKDANDSSFSASYSEVLPKATVAEQMFAEFKMATKFLHEIAAGESVTFEYRAPYNVR